MFARLLATFCLFNFVVVPCCAGSDDPAAADLVLYVRTVSPQSSRVTEIMKRELAPLMVTAGYRVEWRESRGKFESTAATLVVLQLEGDCAASSGSSAPESAAAESRTLASTAISDGTVLPFSTIHCAPLSRVLWPLVGQEGGARREFLYGRAMARLLAHELYHILVNTRDHDRDGIAKSHFTPADLVTERFAFEHTTLAKMARPAAEFTVDSPPEAPSGR